MGEIRTKDGTNLHDKDRSMGKPVVFCHGWPLSQEFVFVDS